MDAIQSAKRTLKNRLDSNEWNPGSRLPSLAELAIQTGVSRTTMWRAVGLLQKESLLHATQRGAIIAGPAGVTRQKKENRGLLWERLTMRIGRDLVVGAYPTQVLPLVTKLAAHYGATIPTMRKALSRLAHEGLLKEAGRRFVQASYHRESYQASIALIVPDGALSLDPRTHEAAISFERECLRLGYPYRIERFSMRDAKSFMHVRKIIGVHNAIRGCIISLWNPWDNTLKARWFDVLDLLAGQNLPTVVIDQAGNLLLPLSLKNRKSLRILRICGAKAGEMVADALLKRGHSRLAFITGSLTLDWVQNRHAGVCRYVQNYGGPHSAVETYSYGEIADITYLVLALLNLDKSDIQLLYGERLSKNEIRNLHAMMDEIQNGKLADIPIARDPATATIRHWARSLVDLSHQAHDPGIYDFELDRLLHTTSDKAIEFYFEPLFKKVLAKSGATAWILPDAQSAISAVAFLKNSGKKVPEEISVFGFDNWRNDLDKQLSTYDFNMNGMVQEALLMINDEKILKSKPMISEVDGYVVERRTTRR
jgi:DNA-binding LacI/PurR family transcriptional regulator/DNA-binding transcriptional regulator YhcF (GntR family)